MHIFKPKFIFIEYPAALLRDEHITDIQLLCSRFFGTKLCSLIVQLVWGPS